MTLFGIKLIGLNPVSAQKFLYSLALIILFYLLRWGLGALAGAFRQGGRGERTVFWMRQGASLFCTLFLILGLVSVWFDNPARLTTAFGLVTAGLAFALQNVVTSVAGYFVILRGKNFSVGDRITMGGVRGDVISLGFIQTTIMEMGQPPAVQGADPAVWVKSRQYTGRIVTAANGQIFKSPVYNYTREFPYIWEEITSPISYKADRLRTEEILMEVARRHTSPVSGEGMADMERMRTHYFLPASELEPRVYYRITDNWLELTVRFLFNVHGVRDVKDAMNRDILTAFDTAGIGIASATYDIVGFPPIRLERVPRREATFNNHRS